MPARIPITAKEMYDRAGPGATFPQIFIGGAHVGGCDELYALDRAGKLDSAAGGRKGSDMTTETTFIAAMIQMRTGLLPEPNLDQATKLIREAAAQGASFVQTPEVSNMMQVNRTALFEHLAERGRRSLARRLSRSRARTENPSQRRLAGAAGHAGEGRQPLVPDRTVRRHPRALRQDPHVRYRSRQTAKAIASPPTISRARPL